MRRSLSLPFSAVALAALLLGGCAGSSGSNGTGAGAGATEHAQAASEYAMAKAGDTMAKAGDTLGMTLTGILGEDEFKALHELKEGMAPTLHGDMIELAGGHAYLALPEGDGPFPAIVVIQEWWGLNANIKHWTDRLAADGYAALAIDLYEGVVATTRDDALAAMQAVEDDRGHEIVRAALDYLKTDSRIRATELGSVGWCFGGGWSLNAAIANPDLDAAVIYYGRLTDDPAELGKIEATVCGVFGNADQGIPPEVVNAFDAALDDANVDHEIHRYDADHAFANPSSARYDHAAAGDAWERVRKFFARELRGEG